MRSANMGARVIAGLFTLLILGAVLDATGGVLAQPERQDPSGDRFIGFQLVYEEMPAAIDMSDPNWEEQAAEMEPEDRSQWVEYGSQTMELEGVGSVSFPREVLIGRYDEESGRYLFPGKKGFNCFLVTRTETNGAVYVSAGADMADVQIGFTDEEDYVRGTVYFGPPLDDRHWNTEDFDYCWTAYRVYQMADGTVYLDGSGNSYGGVGGFTVSEREEYAATVNGKTETKAFEAEFTIESVERVTAVSVKWFDREDRILKERTLNPEEIGDGLSLESPQGAAWVLVGETDRNGRTKRSAYTLGGAEVAAHRLVLLDGRGLGRVVYLTLEETKNTP